MYERPRNWLYVLLGIWVFVPCFSLAMALFDLLDGPPTAFFGEGTSSINFDIGGQMAFIALLVIMLACYLIHSVRVDQWEKRVCTRCEGEGTHLHNGCSYCDGKGWVPGSPCNCEGPQELETCSFCGGAQAKTVTCFSCAGSGRRSSVDSP